MDLDNAIKKVVGSFKKGEKVLVAMSGGVDSSVSAWAAKEAGCDVTGVTLWMCGDGNQLKDAEKIANYLGIKWSLADCRGSFNDHIISSYVNTYKKGQTPNPCCACNRIGKTKYLFDEMQRCGAEKIVTGHYASIVEYEGRKVVSKASSSAKDQSYYLSLMEPFHLGFMVYPLSTTESKDVVRSIAAKVGLEVAPKKDSFEACFLEGKDYREYISEKLTDKKEGDFILHGKRIGSHKGVYNYTIGQRRGLDISHTEPLYVSNIDTASAEVHLAEKKYLFHRGVRLVDCVFHPSEPAIFRGSAKLRHKMPDAACYIEIQHNNKAVVLFDDPQFAPAPGQVTAIYSGDRLVGGGMVESWF